MNTGQTMLVIAAFSLLSILTLSINTTIMTTSTLGLEMEANLNALSIAQSMLDEIMHRWFDEQTYDPLKPVTKPENLTPKANFGTDQSNEHISLLVDSSRTGIFQSQSKFDDVDDYHNYERWVWNDRLGWFVVKDSVNYVKETDPNVIVNYQTWQKKITVVVRNYCMAKDVDGNIFPYNLVDMAVYREYY